MRRCFWLTGKLSLSNLFAGGAPSANGPMASAPRLSSSQTWIRHARRNGAGWAGTGSRGIALSIPIEKDGISGLD